MILVLACAPDTHDKDALFFTKIEPLGPPLGIFQDPDKRTIYLFTFRSNFSNLFYLLRIQQNPVNTTYNTSFDF